MNKVARWPAQDRETLFRNSGEKSKMVPGIIEKDFWVCWTLQYLFQASMWKKHMAFKGGTSLSKCYDGLISRFSEDIDIILDWTVLGYSPEEPWDVRSKTQQDIFNKQMNMRTQDFLKHDFLPQVQADFSESLKTGFEVFIDTQDPQTICFAYPKLLDEESIVPVVRMEIGTLAAWTPTKMTTIHPYAADFYPQVFSMPNSQILTVSAERTFWEKVTILHKEAFRETGEFPRRYSRHYYDLWCMSNSPVKSHALSDTDLLGRVVAFKSRFYPSNAARYDLAKPGTINLVPKSHYINALEKDYQHMQNMIYGECPEFDDLLNTIKKLEEEINHTTASRV